jgi:hypothetical protein
MIKSLLLIVALGVGMTALGQRPGKVGSYSGPTTERPGAVAGRHQVEGFGVAKEPKPKPFPWIAVLMGVLAVGIATPIAYYYFNRTKTELESLKTFGRGASGEKIDAAGDEAPAISRRPKGMSSSGAGGNSARDTILAAVSRSKQWVTAEWVARTAGVSATIVADTLGSLAEEGQVQEARDTAGNPVYRLS